MKQKPAGKKLNPERSEGPSKDEIERKRERILLALNSRFMTILENESERNN